MINEIQSLEDIREDANSSLNVYTKFMVHQTRFLVEWRSGSIFLIVYSLSSPSSYHCYIYFEMR